MEFFEGYFEMIVIGVCLCVGYILKNIIPSERLNRFIPLVMGFLGVVLSLWQNSFTFSPDILLTGLISGLASTGMHQIFKQFIDGGND